MDIDRMTSSELTNYITRNGKVLLDINRLAEAIHKGKVKKIVFPNGQEVDIAGPLEEGNAPIHQKHYTVYNS